MPMRRAASCQLPPPRPLPPLDHPIAWAPRPRWGKKVVREMNRLGMMVDLSHASVQTMKDVMQVSKAPIIFSHSSAFALCNSSRNVPDDVLKLVALNGGIVMVNFYTYFITCNATATIADVIGNTPTGLEDVSKYPQLLARLLEDPDWTEEDIKKLAGKNLLRVFGEVEEIRDKWRLAAVMPGEELIPAIYLKGHTDCMYLGS
ncbi:Dipeptidase [Gryllus bimaculatus]|nr:Dipeptidase [Gryllus bimaculatus]